MGAAINLIERLNNVLSTDLICKGQKDWAAIVEGFFEPKAAMRLTLWKDNQKKEAKPFSFGVSILPRLLYVTAQEGVTSVSVCLDDARERAMGSSIGIECPKAKWVFRYSDGNIVTLHGPLTANIVSVPCITSGGASGQSMFIDKLWFDSITFDETSQIDLRTEQPIRRVNAFGVPQATMRCLELSEALSSMSDLVTFSVRNALDPKVALAQLAQRLREQQTLAASSDVGDLPLPVSGDEFDGDDHYSGDDSENDSSEEVCHHSLHDDEDEDDGFTSTRSTSPGSVSQELTDYSDDGYDIIHEDVESSGLAGPASPAESFASSSTLSSSDLDAISR